MLIYHLQLLRVMSVMNVCPASLNHADLLILYVAVSSSPGSEFYTVAHWNLGLANFLISSISLSPITS